MVDTKKDSVQLGAYLEQLGNGQVDTSLISRSLTDYYGHSEELTEDNIIKNIANEVARDCQQHYMDVLPELAEYVVRLKLLNPKNGFTARHVMQRVLIQNLVTLSVEDLKKDTPAMDLIRLQSYWITKDLDHLKFYRIMKAMRLTPSSECEPILQEIYNNLIITKDDRNELLKSIVMYTILRSGLGNTSMQCLKETSAALGSVFKEQDIIFFASLTREGKRRELELLNHIVAGIRLYHKLRRTRGGEAIENIREVMEDILPYLISQTRQEREQIQERINHITVGLEKAYNLDFLRSLPHDINLEVSTPEGYSRSDVNNLQNVLAILRQLDNYTWWLSVFQGTLLSDLSSSRTSLLNRTCSSVIDTHLLVPTSKIYRVFIELAKSWETQQDVVLRLHLLHEIATKVKQFYKYLDPTPLEVVLCPHTTLDDNARSKEEDEFKINEQNITNPDVTLEKSASSGFGFGFTTFEDIQFSGFCAWTLAQAEGMLLKGVFSIGLLHYSGSRYCFSTANVAYKWAADPHSYISRALNNVRSKPWLVEFLGLYNDLREIQDKALDHKVKKVTQKFNAKAQTVLHPIPKFLDKDYTFSKWVLKRRAIQLANMVKCVTKSVQTVSHSHYRGDIALQCAPDKTRTTQTRQDAGVVHPTVSNYIYGLRGLRGDKARVITLTRPVDEDLACPKKKIFVRPIMSPKIEDRFYSFGEAITVTELKPITSSIRKTKVNP